MNRQDKRQTWSGQAPSRRELDSWAPSPPQSPETSPRFPASRWSGLPSSNKPSSSSWASIPASPRYTPPSNRASYQAPQQQQSGYQNQQQPPQQQHYAHPNYSRQDSYAPRAPAYNSQPSYNSQPPQQPSYHQPPQQQEYSHRQQNQHSGYANGNSWNQGESSYDNGGNRGQIAGQHITQPVVGAGWGQPQQSNFAPPRQPSGPSSSSSSSRPLSTSRTSWGPQDCNQPSRMNTLRKTKSFSVSRAPPPDAIVARGRVGKRPEMIPEVKKDFKDASKEVDDGSRWSVVGTKQQLESVVEELKPALVIKPKATNRSHRIYLHNLPASVRVQEVAAALADSGPILNICLFISSPYIDFELESDQARAVSSFPLEGVRVTLAPTKVDMANPSNTVHIASVPSIVTKGEIELIFEPYGNIVRIQIVGRLARIFCFVEYDSTGAATRAIEALNGKSVFSEEVFGDASPLVLDFSKGKRIADRGWNPEGRKSVETRDDEEEDVEEVSVSLVTGTDGTQLMKVKEEEEEIDEHW